MSTEFVSPAPAAGRPARSPLADAALAAGGRCEERDGWEVATSFGDAPAEADACRQTVGFADLSPLAKLELQGPAERLERVCGRLEPGTALPVDGGWRCPVAPTLALALAEPGAGEGLREEAEEAGVRVCDLTAALAALALVGPLARDVFARFCALDLRESALPVGGFRPGSVARTPGYLLRQGPDRFLVMFGAAYGQYVWETVADAAGHLGGRPVGLDALTEPSGAPHA